MKKAVVGILICFVMCMSICLTGCSNEFAKQEYNDTEKIVQIEDRNMQVMSVFLQINGGYSLKVAKFDGRETLWKKNLIENTEMVIRLDMSISNGFAKVVYIDSDNNLTVLAECTEDDSKAQSVTKTISLTSGLNRLKIVGYDCKEIDLKMYFDEP